MARKTGHNKSVYEERIKNELNMILRREVSDSRLTMVSVTRVELNPDYSMADVYWDTFDASTRGDAKSAVDKMAGRMRTLLAKTLNARHTPALTFHYDSQFEDELKIEKLIHPRDE